MISSSLCCIQAIKHPSNPLPYIDSDLLHSNPISSNHVNYYSMSWELSVLHYDVRHVPLHQTKTYPHKAVPTSEFAISLWSGSTHQHVHRTERHRADLPELRVHTTAVNHESSEAVQHHSRARVHHVLISILSSQYNSVENFDTDSISALHCSYEKKLGILQSHIFLYKNPWRAKHCEVSSLDVE